jgi:hypothetical protein
MEKYLVPVTSISKSTRPRQALGKQRTLESLGKVVIFDKGTSPGNPTEESLNSAALVLQNNASSDDELLDALRKLSSYTMVSVEVLRATGVGTSVRLLKKHHNTSVSRVSLQIQKNQESKCPPGITADRFRMQVAGKLTEKWKGILVGQQRKLETVPAIRIKEGS